MSQNSIFNITGDLTTISSYSFQSCTALKNVNISSSVTKIGDFAFSSCNSLESITLPDTINFIGKDAFSSCTSLKTFKIPRDLTIIPENLCLSCDGLHEVIVNSNGILYESNCFGSCHNLKSITFESQNICDLIIDGAFIDTPLETITITNKNVTILSNSFGSSIYTSLTNVDISDGYALIFIDGFDGFNGDDSTLRIDCKNVTLKSSNNFQQTFKSIDITSFDSIVIYNNTFSGATELSTINLDGKTVEINGGAFSNCMNLGSIYIRWKSFTWNKFI